MELYCVVSGKAPLPLSLLPPCEVSCLHVLEGLEAWLGLLPLPSTKNHQGPQIQPSSIILAHPLFPQVTRYKPLPSSTLCHVLSEEKVRPLKCQLFTETKASTQYPES